jgi:hypothetical protein
MALCHNACPWVNDNSFSSLGGLDSDTGDSPMSIPDSITSEFRVGDELLLFSKLLAPVWTVMNNDDVPGPPIDSQMCALLSLNSLNTMAEKKSSSQTCLEELSCCMGVSDVTDIAAT